MEQSLTISSNPAIASRSNIRGLLFIFVLFALSGIGIAAFKTLAPDDAAPKPFISEEPEELPKGGPIGLVKLDTDDDEERLKYVTYTKYNPITGQYYAGRTSGRGVPEQIVKKRDYCHHRNAEGYLSAVLDRWHFDYRAIRGREQQIIDVFGGAWSEVGKDSTESGNKIRAISRQNRNLHLYIFIASKSFGEPIKVEFINKHQMIQ